MAWTIFKVILASGVITFTSWLANSQPRLAGFIIALPISSMLALAFNYAQFQNEGQSSAFARSILVGVPLSLLFFVPFLFSAQLKWGFGLLYGAGIALLAIGYFVHKAIFPV
jgi:hypothetical protein